MSSYQSDEDQDYRFEDNEFLQMDLSYDIDDYNWDVTFKKGKELNKLRRNNTLSLFNKSYEEAEKYGQKVKLS